MTKGFESFAIGDQFVETVDEVLAKPHPEHYQHVQDSVQCTGNSKEQGVAEYDLELLFHDCSFRRVHLNRCFSRGKSLIQVSGSEAFDSLLWCGTSNDLEFEVGHDVVNRLAFISALTNTFDDLAGGE